MLFTYDYITTLLISLVVFLMSTVSILKSQPNFFKLVHHIGRHHVPKADPPDD